MFENWGAFVLISELLFVLTAAFNALIQSDEHIVVWQAEVLAWWGCHVFSTENPSFPSSNQIWLLKCTNNTTVSDNIQGRTLPQRGISVQQRMRSWSGRKQNSICDIAIILAVLWQAKLNGKEDHFSIRRPAHPAGLGEKLTGLSCGIAITECWPNHKQENIFLKVKMTSPLIWCGLNIRD